MIKEVVLIAIFTTLSSGFPTHAKSTVSGETVVIIPAEKDDLQTAETFYSGYNTGYPGGGYGWKGDHRPVVGGPVYGGGYDIGSYVGVPVGSYGTYAPGTVVVGGRPIATGGGGYGWRQGVNPWAL